VADPKRVYTGWLVDAAARDGLLARLPPRYPRVVAHHVTLKFGDRAGAPPTDTLGEIVGEADDGCGRSTSPGRWPTNVRRGRATTSSPRTGGGRSTPQSPCG
jgi:hypothetical protein